jgi:hypothetical protein
MKIQDYQNDGRFNGYSNAFLVTGVNEPELDDFNRRLLATNRSGYWDVRAGRINTGDLLFLILPSLSRPNGYPRELYAGRIVDIEEVFWYDRDRPRREIYTVDNFIKLDAIESDVKLFLNGVVPPMGNHALTIWGGNEPPSSPLSKDLPEKEAFPEGGKQYALHIRYERKPVLARLVKDRAIAQYGRLACEACGFDFSKVYGARGDGYIEAHHKVPVSQLGEESYTRADDLALVCSNCHSMLHRMSPLPTVEELRNLIAQTSENR